MIGMSGSVDVRVGRGDLLVVPVGDLAEEDLGVDVARQLELGDARQVVGDDDLARGHRQEHDAVGLTSAICSSVIAASLAAKSTTWLMKSWMPAPEPLDW